MLNKLLVACVLSMLAIPAIAQAPPGAVTRSQMQSDITADFPNNNAGAITPSILRNFLTEFTNSAVVWDSDSPLFVQMAGLPGLSTNVFGTGFSGLELPCTAVANCGWFILQVPTTIAADEVASLRVQKGSSGVPAGGSNAFINNTIFALNYTPPYSLDNEWTLESQMINQTVSSTGAVQVAMNATAGKDTLASQGGSLPQGATVTISNGTPAVVTWAAHGLSVHDHMQFTGTLPTGLSNGVTYFVIAAGLTVNSFEISATNNGSPINTSSAGTPPFTAIVESGTTFAANFNCIDNTGIVNPGNSCVGAEIDVQSAAGSGADANKQRLALQVTGAATTLDTNVHIGTLLLLSAANGAVIDDAIDLKTTAGTEVLVTAGNGSTVVRSTATSWSTSNFSPEVVIGGQGGLANPAFGLFDLNNANGWAIANGGPNLQFIAMPAITDSTDAGSLWGSVARSTGVWTFPSGVAGATGGSYPSAGQVGEVLTSTVGPTTVSMTSTQAKNITSVALTAGNWDCDGNVITGIPAGNLTAIAGSISTSTGAEDAANLTAQTIATNTTVVGFPVPHKSFSLSGSQTTYLVATFTFTSTLTAGGTLTCKRTF